MPNLEKTVSFQKWLNKGQNGIIEAWVVIVPKNIPIESTKKERKIQQSNISETVIRGRWERGLASFPVGDPSEWILYPAFQGCPVPLGLSLGLLPCFLSILVIYLQSQMSWLLPSLFAFLQQVNISITIYWDFKFSNLTFISGLSLPLKSRQCCQFHN